MRDGREKEKEKQDNNRVLYTMGKGREKGRVPVHMRDKRYALKRGDRSWHIQETIGGSKHKSRKINIILSLIEDIQSPGQYLLPKSLYVTVRLKLGLYWTLVRPR